MVSNYHHVAIAWDPVTSKDKFGVPIAKCTCQNFMNNGVYCAHMLGICNDKGIFSIEQEVRKLDKVNKAGRPKKITYA